MSDRVDLEVINYGRRHSTGPFQVFLSVPGEADENGRKTFREVVQGPSIKAILDEIEQELGSCPSMPQPTHVHGQEIEGDLFKAIMAARDRWM